MVTLRTVGLGAALAVALLGATLAQGAPGKDGRYTMSPVEGGFLRLDTHTGAVSLCSDKTGTWACKAVEDNSAQLRARVDDLEAQNKSLREEILRMEETFGLAGPKDGEGTKQAEKPNLGLPSEKDVDKALDYLEGMLKKFRDRYENFDKEFGGDPNDPPERPL